jgi:hypothetical protein
MASRKFRPSVIPVTGVRLGRAWVVRAAGWCLAIACGTWCAVWGMGCDQRRESMEAAGDRVRRLMGQPNPNALWEVGGVGCGRPRAETVSRRGVPDCAGVGRSIVVMAAAVR